MDTPPASTPAPTPQENSMVKQTTMSVLTALLVFLVLNSATGIFTMRDDVRDLKAGISQPVFTQAEKTALLRQMDMIQAQNNANTEDRVIMHRVLDQILASVHGLEVSAARADSRNGVKRE